MVLYVDQEQEMQTLNMEYARKDSSLVVQYRRGESRQDNSDQPRHPGVGGSHHRLEPIEEQAWPEPN